MQNRGWGRKAKKLAAKKSGNYYQRTNIRAEYVNHKSIAPMVLNDFFHTKLFEACGSQLLVKELKLGQIVIMDNSAFHRSQKTKELL
ncbi:hypothetical protein P618_200374 [Holospora obtusa F1]|uniref:Tc1-like transposase DDE domain-containing protein n=1 Tax=Holospora obtusa F1 TaxID=1399147 RepID=W6TEU0_HOLOB|nr:transposase [Holospora obtusa]ETZ07426.1 hypothetical protein P618_200374 [Holospora obtusa F1]